MFNIFIETFNQSSHKKQNVWRSMHLLLVCSFFSILMKMTERIGWLQSFTYVDHAIFHSVPCIIKFLFQPLIFYRISSAGEGCKSQRRSVYLLFTPETCMKMKKLGRKGKRSWQPNVLVQFRVDVLSWKYLSQKFINAN